MICDIKYTIGLYKQGKITDLVLARSLTDHVSKVTPNIKVIIVRSNLQCSAGRLSAMQTIPERICGKIFSVIFIDQRLITAMDTCDFIETLHKEVKNNTIYLKIFSKFLTKNKDTNISRSETLATLLEMYSISCSQMSKEIVDNIFKAGASFTCQNDLGRYKDMLINGEVSFLKAIEYLETLGLPHWISNCCEVIAAASSNDEQIFEINYFKSDVNATRKSITDNEKKESSNIEEYVIGSCGVHTKIFNATDVVSRQDFRYPNKGG